MHSELKSRQPPLPAPHPPASLPPSFYEGAYFVSRQSNGTAVYHDILPSAGARFIDMAKFPQALGFELPKVSKKGTAGAAGKEIGGGEELSALKAARAASFARVIGLDFLLDDVVGRVHALDFKAFRANDKLQPLHVVVSVRAWRGWLCLALLHVRLVLKNLLHARVTPPCRLPRQRIREPPVFVLGLFHVWCSSPTATPVVLGVFVNRRPRPCPHRARSNG